VSIDKAVGFPSFDEGEVEVVDVSVDGCGVGASGHSPLGPGVVVQALLSVRSTVSGLCSAILQYNQRNTKG